MYRSCHLRANRHVAVILIIILCCLALSEIPTTSVSGQSTTINIRQPILAGTTINIRAGSHYQHLGCQPPSTSEQPTTINITAANHPQHQGSQRPSTSVQPTTSALGQSAISASGQSTTFNMWAAKHLQHKDRLSLSSSEDQPSLT